MQAECQDKSTKCIFKRNLNPILIFHGSFPNSVLFSPSLSFSLGLSRCRFTPTQSPSLFLSFFSFDRPLPPPLTPSLDLSLSLSPASLYLPRWFSFWVGTCYLFFTSLSRVAESFSMEPWIMFMGRNDKKCYLRRTITIARAEATGLYLSDYYLVRESEHSFA